MTGAAQSAVAYRPLIRATVGDPGSGDDIANMNTAPLTNGAECYVTQNRSVYRLAKFSTIAANGTTVILPIAGGGRWLLVGSAGAALAASVYSTLGLNNSFNLTAAWSAPTTANFEAALTAGLWTLSPSTCLLTYLGPTTPALVRLTAAMSAPGGEGAVSVYAGVAYEDDLTGTLAGSNGGARGGTFYTQRASSEDVVVVATQRRIAALAAGEIIQPKFGSVADEASGTVYDLQLTIEAA